MVDKSKYHITFVSVSEGIAISDLESLLQQRFKLSPARANKFFQGDDKIVTPSLEKAKKFRAYFLQQGVVVRIAPAVKMRPFIANSSTPSSPVSSEDNADLEANIDHDALLKLHMRLAKAEQLIITLQHEQRGASAKIKRLEEALVNQQGTIIDLKARLPSQPATPADAAEASSEPTDTTSQPQAKPKRRAVWRVARDSIIIASLAAAWLLFSQHIAVKDVIRWLPFIDHTPAIATALETNAQAMQQLTEMSQAYLSEQQAKGPEVTAAALMYASEQQQISIEGLVAVAEVLRCTQYQFTHDLSFIDAHLQDLVWQHITAAQLLQYKVIGKDTIKLVQLGANGNCSSAESNQVVTKLAFDAYIQQHLQ